MLDVCLLGTGGMLPLPDRWLTACLLRYEGEILLIDCGEGTQITMRKTGWSFKDIRAIAFTHYHGDHISGLPGMLLTIGNTGRTEPLLLMGPRQLRYVVEGLLRIAPDIPYPIEYKEITDLSEEITVGGLHVHPFRADHRISCLGYRVDVLRRPRFLPDQARALKIPIQYWKVLQQGQTVECDGKIFTPDQVLGEARKGLSVAYCTDSRPKDTIVEGARGVDLFICEGMYGEEEKIDKAREHKHMLFSEAAAMAREACVKELWLTHYSPAMTHPKEFLEETQKIFPNTKVCRDRQMMTLNFDEK